MKRLEWRSIRPKQGKRDLGALVLHWKSLAPLPIAPSPSDQASRSGDLRARVIVDADVSILFFAAHGFAEGSHILIYENDIWQCNAQSEAEVANWEHLLRLETKLAHRRSWVLVKACRATGSREERVALDLAELESLRMRVFEILRRIDRSHEERSRASAPAPTKKTTVESAGAEADGADPESRCRAIVEALQRPGLEQEERRKLILEAEVLPFRGQQAAALVPWLRRFIETYRESNVPADLVAVGSAIRNYIATAVTDDAFQAAASLLKAQSRLPIPIELEVEVTKMVVRKLTPNPPAERDQYTELALRLEELVDAYAKPRFLAREKYGAVALNAVLGLVLTRSGRDAELVERMRTLDVPWFQQILARRAARLRADLLARVGGEIRRHRPSPGTTQRFESVHSRIIGGRRMPAQRVGSTPIAIRRFEVVGQDASGEPGFVGHVALAAEDHASYAASAVLPVSHMRPPLETEGECYAHCVGSAGLTVDEELQIRLFCEEVESEYRAARLGSFREQYVICPQVKEVRREDQTVVYRRFSCVGFVLEAYREAQIDVLWTDLAPCRSSGWTP